MNGYLIDTNICIALRKEDPVVFDRLRAIEPTEVSVSSITVFEMRYGAANSSRPDENNAVLDRFFSFFTVLPFDETDALASGRIRADLKRRGKPIGPFDTLIAGQALARDLVVVTNNRREFDRVEGLVVEDWT